MKKIIPFILLINFTIYGQDKIHLAPIYPQYENNWFSIGSHSDVLNAPIGISIGNGIIEEQHIHFENHTHLLTYNIYYAQDLESKNKTYGGKISLTNTAGVGLNLGGKSSFLDPTIAYNMKDYSKAKIESYSISSNILYLKNISSYMYIKIGYQRLDNIKNTGIVLGLKKLHYGSYTFGLDIGYWKDYLSYETYLSKFVWKKKIMAHLKLERVENNNFMNIGISYLFNIRKKIKR